MGTTFPIGSGACRVCLRFRSVRAASTQKPLTAAFPKVAHHTFPRKLTPGHPGELRSDHEVAEQFLTSSVIRDLAQLRPQLTHSHSAESLQFATKVGRTRRWPNWAQVWPSSNDVGRHLSDIGHPRPTFGQLRRSLFEQRLTWSEWTNLGRIWAESELVEHRVRNGGLPIERGFGQR